MALRMSTGLRDAILDNADFKTTLADGVIYIYSGAQPATADTAKAGTLLGIVSLSAGAFSHGTATNGLEFGSAASGAIAKAVAEVWQMSGIAAGVAGWFRFSGNAADDQLASTTLARLDGSISKSGGSGDLKLSNVDIVIGAPTTVDTFQVSIPAG